MSPVPVSAGVLVENRNRPEHLLGRVDFGCLICDPSVNSLLSVNTFWPNVGTTTREDAEGQEA